MAIPNAISGDALDDDFDLDDALLASDTEEPESVAGPSNGRHIPARVSDEEDEFALDDEDDADSEEVAEQEVEESQPERKAKRAKTQHKFAEEENVPEAEEQELDDFGLPINRKKSDEKDGFPPRTAPSTLEEKKRKRKEKVKEAKRKKAKNQEQEEAGIETSAVALQPPALQADYLAEKQVESMSKLSSIEREEVRIAERYILDVSAITERQSLKAFVKKATGLKEKDLKKDAISQPGQPKLLILSGAALRTADVIRDVRDLVGKGTEVAKLFAKHFKLAEHCRYCEETKFPIGAGTPDRILKLIEADALKLDELSHFMLDLKKDSKKRNLLDIPESRLALFKLLANEKLLDRLRSGQLKLVFY